MTANLARSIVSVGLALFDMERAFTTLRQRGHVICRDAQEWLERTALDTSPAVVALRQRLDWRTGEAVTTCRECSAEVRYPIWLFNPSATRALVLEPKDDHLRRHDPAPLRACPKHRRHHETVADPLPQMALPSLDDQVRAG